jgi:hypothetical protein
VKKTRVQEAIEILKASVEDSSVKGRRVPKPAPRTSKKVLVKAKKVQKN